MLRRLHASGALRGRIPAEAYFIKCDAETNPPEVRDAGQLVAEIGHCGRGRVGLEVFRRKVVGLSQRIERAQLGEPLWVDENWALVDADPRTLMQAATDIVAVLDTARTAGVVVEGAA